MYTLLIHPSMTFKSFPRKCVIHVGSTCNNENTGGLQWLAQNVPLCHVCMAGHEMG